MVSKLNDIELKEEKLYLDQLGISLPFHLVPCQMEALRYIMQNEAFLAVLPTSLGKTILAVLQAIYSAKVKNKKSCIIAPYKSLTTEHVHTLEKYLNTMLDNGEHPKTIGDYQYCDYDVVISTFEKMDSIIRQYEPEQKMQRRDVVFKQFDSIIIDEIHGIEDEERGTNLESFIMSVHFLYPHIKIIGLSATIGNKEFFADWLKAKLVYAPPNERPVPLNIQIIQLKEYVKSRQYNEKIDYLNQDLRIHSKDKVMIAVTAVNRTKGIIKDLCGHSKDSDYDIKYYMQNFNMGWHYSGKKGMSEEDRLAVEWAFEYDDIPEDDNYELEYTSGRNTIRDTINRKQWLLENYGMTHGINLVVCTPTLIVGRNLPVTRIYVFDHTQFNYKYGEKLIKNNRLQQTIGRAGRLKFAKGNPNYSGEAIIFAPFKDAQEMYNRATQPFDIVSNLKEVLGEKILAWINSQIVKNDQDIFNFLSLSLDSNLRNNKKLIASKLEYLEKHKFIKRDDLGNITITVKGKKTIKYYIQPETVVSWGYTLSKYIKTMAKGNDFRLDKFMINLMDVEEFIKDITILDKEKFFVESFAEQISMMEQCSIDERPIKAFMFCFPEYSYEVLKHRFSEESIHKELVIPSEESRSMTNQFERLNQALYEIYGYTSLGESIEACKNMVESKIFNLDIAKLMQLPGIGLTYATRLNAEKIKTKEGIIKLYKSDPRKLSAIMLTNSTQTRKIVEKIIEIQN